MNMGQFRSLVQAATGIKHTHRLRDLDFAITESTFTDGALLSCDDDPDYDEDFDFGTTAPECEPGSRVLGIDLTMDLVPSAAGEQIEWILYKSPDGLLNGVPTGPLLFQMDLTANVALIRKYTLAYGRFLSTSSRESSRTRVRISRAAMRRAGVMHDGDILRMNFIHTAAASPGSGSIHGRIWTRK